MFNFFSLIAKFYTREMTIFPWFAKLNIREFEKIRHSRNFVPAKLNTFKVLYFLKRLGFI